MDPVVYAVEGTKRPRSSPAPAHAATPKSRGDLVALTIADVAGDGGSEVTCRDRSNSVTRLITHDIVRHQ